MKISLLNLSCILIFEDNNKYINWNEPVQTSFVHRTIMVSAG